MSNQITTAMIQGYRANVEIQFQQKGSRLRDCVTVESQNSEFEFYDRIGPTDAVEILTRHGDTPLIETPHDRRKISLRDFDWADLVDRKDQIRILASPESKYAINAGMALGRKMDDVIIQAATGTAYTGKTGSTTVSFAAASEVAVDFVHTGAATNSNLTISKLRETARLLKVQEAVERGEIIHFILAASQETSLLRSTEVTSADYNTVKALVNGEINTFMGFQFTRTERLTVASNIRDCLAFPARGITLAIADDINVDIGPRRDKRNSIQVYARASFGASRMWEEQVIRIKCDETK